MSIQFVPSVCQGEVVYDDAFSEAFSLQSLAFDYQAVSDLCRLCKLIINNTDLVRPNSTQCVPEYVFNGGAGKSGTLT